MKIETFKLENQGLENKTIWYVKFSTEHKTYIMNIGYKSYETITEMLKQPENTNLLNLQLNEEKIQEPDNLLDKSHNVGRRRNG